MKQMVFVWHAGEEKGLGVLATLNGRLCRTPCGEALPHRGNHNVGEREAEPRAFVYLS